MKSGRIGFKFQVEYLRTRGGFSLLVPAAPPPSRSHLILTGSAGRLFSAGRICTNI